MDRAGANKDVFIVFDTLQRGGNLAVGIKTDGGLILRQVLPDESRRATTHAMECAMPADG